MLSPYSSQTLADLLAAFPHLAEAVEECEDYFKINLNSPSGHLLLVYSEGDELTVGFAEHHLHFGSFNDAGAGADPAFDVARAIDYLQQLFVGVTAVAAWFKKGVFCLSYTFIIAEDPIPAEPSFIKRRWMRKRNVEVRTWLT